MAEHWFRSYHGAPTDPKWIIIGRRAQVAPGVVAALWWALMDHASQATPRGSVAGFDLEAVAAFYGWGETQCNAVLVTMRERKMIDAETGMLSAWIKRNPKREDDSRDRVRRYRDKQKLEDSPQLPPPRRNAVKRNVTLDKRRVEEKRETDTPPISPPGDGYSDEFSTAWQEYPPRTGGNSKTAAWKAWKARLNQGHTAVVMLAGVRRYAAYCFAAGKLRTEFVKQAATFFGPDLHFLEKWDVPPPENGKVRNGSQAAAVRNERPAEAGGRQGTLTRADGHDPEAEKERKEKEEAERADAWARNHPEEASMIADEVSQAMADDPRWIGSPRKLLAEIAKAEFRRRILERLTPRVA